MTCVKYYLIALMALLMHVPHTAAFLPSHAICPTTAASSPTRREAQIVLSERRWNFNDGQSPWGMKKNAEIWNGRVAQELFQGKGVIQSLQEGNALNIATLGVTAATVVGLTAFLATQGDDDYTKNDLEGI